MQQLFIRHVPCASLMSMPRSPLSRVSPLHSCAVLRLPPPQWHQTTARSGRRVATVTLRLEERLRTWCPCGGEEQKSDETVLPKPSVRQGEPWLLYRLSQRTLQHPDGVWLCFETVWAASLAHLSDPDSSWCWNKKHSSWCSCVLKTSPFLKMNLDKFPDYTSGSLIYSSKDQNGG